MKTICQGRFSKELLDIIKTEITTIKNQYLVEYTIISSRPFSSKKQLGEIELTFQLPPNAIPLEDYIKGRVNPLEIDLRRKLEAKLWEAFWNVKNTLFEISNNIRFLCFTPTNVYVSEIVSKSQTIVGYDIYFTNYFPEVFYNDIVLKKNRVKKAQIYKVMKEEYCYISPRYFNTGSKDCEPLVGVEKISTEDMLYSFGLLLAFIETERSISENNPIESILNWWYNGRINPIYKDCEDLFCREFLKTILTPKISLERIQNHPFVNVLKCHLNEKEMSLDGIEMIQQITSGDFSDDYIAYQKLSDKTERIIVTKQFDLKKDGVYWNDVIREFDRMSYSKHPNFLEPYSVFKMIYSEESEFEGSFEFAYIFLEYCDLNSLAEYMTCHYKNGCPDKQFIEYVFTELLTALWFLHSEQQTIHGDIKPEHILLKTNPKDKKYPFIKLIGLGNSQRVFNEEEAFKTSIGTKAFMAPEVQNPTTNYSYKIDLWSLAVTMYYLVTFQLPFGNNTMKIFNHMCYSVLPVFCEGQWKELSKLKTLLMNLFVFDEDERWGWPQIFRDNYVRELLVKKKEREMKQLGGNSTSNEIQKMVTNEIQQRNYQSLFALQSKTDI